MIRLFFGARRFIQRYFFELAARLFQMFGQWALVAVEYFPSWLKHDLIPPIKLVSDILKVRGKDNLF